jgi:hypothetical protein
VVKLEKRVNIDPGIGSGIQAEELIQTGVTHIMPDLIDNDYFFEVLGIPKRQINRL